MSRLTATISTLCGLRGFRQTLQQRGYTVIEIAIIIVTLGIIAAVAIPRFADMAESSKINATKQEMMSIKTAIVGNPSAVAGGEYVDRGYEGDVGSLPATLQDLVVKPDTVSGYDPISRLGWNGPYMDSAGGEYRTDAWGNNYVFNPATRTILSTGGGSDTIRVVF
ncbi:hypothetical protein GF377_04745 [candidate division GN15 bacterium]|nr:hypothetical protein [candidate division GN15 bacterium]